MIAIDWEAITAEEQLEVLRTAPPVATHWHKPSWDPPCSYRGISPPHLGNAAFVRSTPEGFGVTVCSKDDVTRAAHLGFYKTMEEGKAAADAELQRRGWRIVR